MTLISAMIAFVVLLLGTYSYSAPILSETQNATVAIELQNSTTKTSIEDIADALEVNYSEINDFDLFLFFRRINQKNEDSSDLIHLQQKNVTTNLFSCKNIYPSHSSF